MGKVRTKSGWLGDEVGTWVSYDDYKKLKAQLNAVRGIAKATNSTWASEYQKGLDAGWNICLLRVNAALQEQKP